MKDLALDTTLSHYRVMSKLGAGGMGEVYLAEDTSELDRTVALKILPAELACDQGRMQRFIQEAKTISALNHPNILTIHEIGQEDGLRFIVTEYIDGVTLREHMRGRRVRLHEMLEIAAQVAAALDSAHEAKIVHRDIKPENIMIRRRDSIVKVLDFGLAKPTERAAGARQAVDTEAGTQVLMHTEPGLVMGTVAYMSPEQSQGAARVDHRTDLWSLGVVLYEVVAGRVPFEGQDIHRQIIAIQEQEPPPLSRYAENVPERLEEIVAKALAKSADERYQTAKDFLIDLRNLKRRLEVDAEIERTVAPELRRTSGGATSGPAPARPASGQPAGHTAAVERARPTSSAEYVVNEIKRHRAAALLALIMITCAGLAYAIYHFTRSARPAVLYFQRIKLTRLTAEGKVESAAVSPDGKYIAYSLEEGGRRSLWTKHPATASRVQIVPPAEALVMNACTFSPDGGYVYYTKVDEQNPRGALYQVPVLGGPSKKILADVTQPVSISPDGKQLAFQRLRRTGTSDELFLANVDGTGERLLLEVREPQWLVGGAPAWSPDGHLLVTGYGDGKAMVPAVVSVADGAVRPITSRGWLFIGSVAWLADGGDVVFTAREQVLGALQIWQASYPGGEVRRITNDLSSYAAYSLSLTPDAGSIVSVQGDPISNIWVAPDGDASRARAVTARKNVQEGHYAVAWTPDGKLMFDSDANGKSSIWVVNADGSDPRPLTDGTADDYAPQASPDGRTIIFGSRRSNLYEVWRMDSDGSNPKQLTEETGVPTFSVSPDGRWVIYSPFVGGIRKVSVDGGPPVELVAEGDQRNPQVSPDGKLLAYFFNDEHTKRPKLAVINSEGGVPVKTFNLPVTSSGIFESGFSSLYRGFHWSPDGRALVYINTVSGVSNLWRQPLDGGKPVQITDFKSDLIYNFAYAPDGRTLALARGSHTRDAVLISDVK